MRSETILRKIWAGLLKELRAEVRAEKVATRRADPLPFQTKDYRFLPQDQPGFDQGKEYLADQDRFEDWVARFRPSVETSFNPLDASPGSNVGFEIEPPASFPAIVVHTRVRQSGRVAYMFYWDFVLPSEFETPTPAAPDSESPATDSTSQS